MYVYIYMCVCVCVCISPLIIGRMLRWLVNINLF